MNLIIVCSVLVGVLGTDPRPNRPKTIEVVAARLKAKQQGNDEKRPNFSEMSQKDISGYFLEKHRDQSNTNIIDAMMPTLIESGKVPKSRKALEASVVHARRRARGGESLTSIIEKIFDENPGYVHLDNRILIPLVIDRLESVDTIDEKNIGIRLSQLKRKRVGPKYTKRS